MTDAEEYSTQSLVALERALYQTRAYERWRLHDPGGSSPVDERYRALPGADKAFIRGAFPDGLVPAGRDLQGALARGELEWVSTSGTTDECVTNLWNQGWWDFSEEASWGLNSHASRVCTGEHREAILTSARNVGFLSDGAELPYAARRLGRFLYLNERSSPSLWTEATAARIAAELERFRPVVLEANPSYLARFALAAERAGLCVPDPELIVFTYENPSQLHLRQIRRVFGAPFASSYGTTEAGYVLMECEHGSLHVNGRSCRVDPVAVAGLGDDFRALRVTPFRNEWVALLRFDPGDIVRVRPGGPCPCGRNGADAFGGLEGRMKSVTRTCEGRPVTQGELDRILAAEEGLALYQLVQEGASSFELRAVLRHDSRRGSAERLREALTWLYGKAATVRVEPCDRLEPEASGKFLLAKVAAPAQEASE